MILCMDIWYYCLGGVCGLQRCQNFKGGKSIMTMLDAPEPLTTCLTITPLRQSLVSRRTPLSEINTYAEIRLVMTYVVWEMKSCLSRVFFYHKQLQAPTAYLVNGHNIIVIHIILLRQTLTYYKFKQYKVYVLTYVIFGR